MITQRKEQKQTPTQLKLDTYLVVMASHELDPDEQQPMPADTQVLELPYPSDTKVDKAFLEKDLKGWLQHGYFIQNFSKRGIDDEF